MANAPLQTLVRQLRRLATRAGAAPGDAELLRRFVAGHDQAAFELLVWRHGAMVLDLCRRLLRHEQDAEDAFQAAFLALARKAGSLRRPGAVGPWLYRVAYRVALRAAAGRRAAREVPLAREPAREPDSGPVWRDLRPVLDEEINRLPEKYRAAFVLCCLEGKTVAEVAQELGCPRGTVGARLSRVRERLRCRLARRGLAPATGLLAAAWAGSTASAAPAPALIGCTVEAAATVAAGGAAATVVSARAAALTEGVLHAMFLRKVMTGLLCVPAAAVLGLAGFLPARQPTPAARGQTGAAASPRRLGPADAVKPRVLRADGHVWAVAWSPDGKTLATASDAPEPVKANDPRAGRVASSTVRLWDVRERRERISFGAESRTMIQALAFSPDGKTLALKVNKPMEVNRSELRLVDPNQGRVQRSIEIRGHLGGVAIAPDGRTLALAVTVDEGGWRTLLLQFWDVAGGTRRREIRRKAEAELVGGELTLRAGVGAVCFAPDGKTLATVEDGGSRLRLWDVAAGRLIHTLEEPGVHIHAVTFSPDGRALACACDKLGARIWDPQTGKLRRALETNYRQTLAVAFSPDGKLLATGGSAAAGDQVKGRVTLWDARRGERLRDMPAADLFLCTAVKFAPDGRTLAGALAGERHGQAAGEVLLWPLE
jgi:RNA polymerase sigma factor (sigma-70 family)